MTFEQILNSIEKREFSPLYLLHGEESFFIDKIVELIQNSVLSEQQQEFNQMLFYGKDADPQHIVSSARQYPMMAEHRVIIIKEAQQMKLLPEIAPYIENPVKSTILVVAFKGKKFDMRTAIGKTFKNKGVAFESKKLYENQVPNWIKSFTKTLDIKLTDSACNIMTALLGNDLSKIGNELEKLKITVNNESVIDVEDIKNNIGLSREFNIFELNNALGNRDIQKVFRIVDVFSTNPSQYPVVVIISTLYGFFSKILMTIENSGMKDNELSSLLKVNPFFIKDYRKAARIYSKTKLYEIFKILKDFDLRSKGVDSRSVTQMELIKEMILKILY